MQTRSVVITLGIVAALAVGGDAFASSGITAPAANGKVYSCYSATTGAIRVVNASTKCRRGERRLAWNQTGVRGPAGKPAPNGAVHVVGTAGAPAYGPFMQAYGSPPFADLSYYQDGDHTVHLSGLACRRNLSVAGCIDGVGFAGSQAVFTLPSGFRPGHEHVFAATTFGFGTYYTARVDVDPAGVVSIIYPPQSGLAWISFDGISFRAGT